MAIFKLVDDENVDIDKKNYDIVDDIVDNIGVCGGAERESRVQSSCLQILQRPR